MKIFLLGLVLLSKGDKMVAVMLHRDTRKLTTFPHLTPEGLGRDVLSWHVVPRQAAADTQRLITYPLLVSCFNSIITGQLHNFMFSRQDQHN